MNEFWETNFKQKSEMWGLLPVESAIETALEFSERNYKSILIPGYGYGRNAKAFTNLGLSVTGIEISETAIQLAAKNFGSTDKIYHGSVSDMPFDENTYDGIYCYALLHLLSESERLKFLEDCFNQLQKNGTMTFITLSKSDNRFGKGAEIIKDTFEMPYGVNLYFYDDKSIKKDFKRFGKIETREIIEKSENHAINSFIHISCKKIKNARSSKIK